MKDKRNTRTVKRSSSTRGKKSPRVVGQREWEKNIDSAMRGDGHERFSSRDARKTTRLGGEHPVIEFPPKIKPTAEITFAGIPGACHSAEYRENESRGV